MKNRVEVEIFDNSCVLVGDEDEEYIKGCADYVDKKIREVVKKTSTISTLRAIILAAVNITDQLFKLQKEHSALQDSLLKREEDLVFKIDEVLKLHDQK